MIDPVIELTLRALLSLLFAAAAWHKISARTRFTASLEAYALLPASLLSPVSVLLPAVELSLAAGFLYTSTRAQAALGSIALLTLYTVAIAANLARGRREIDCGCFASSARVPLTPWLIARNLVLIAAAALLVAPVRARAILWVDQLTVLTAVLGFLLLWSAAQRLGQTGPALQHLGGRQ